MSSTRWNELQTRWASGERLSAAEERERHDRAAGDTLAERELALFEELRALGDGAEELPKAVVDRVLAEVGARPRLHLLAPGERAPAIERTPHRRRVWLLAAAIAVPLAAGAAAFVAVRMRAPTEPSKAASVQTTSRLARSELVLASGEVTSPNGAGVGGRPLAAGDRLTTADGRLCLGVDPGIDVCLGAQSEVVVDSLRSDDIRIRVERGTAIAALTSREAGHRFGLTSGDVSVTAHGTVFALEHRPSDILDVVVIEGTVEVAGGRAAPALVREHSRLRLENTGSRNESEPVGRGEESRLWALLTPRELWAKPELGVLQVSSGEPGLELAVDGQAPLALPLRVFVPAGRRSVLLRTRGGKEVTSEVDVTAGGTFVLDPNELLVNRGAPEAPAPSSTPASLLARARQELAAGNAGAALSLYERLRSSYPASPEARTVLVTIGNLELDLKRPGRALTSFERYLATPGSLSPEALAGKIRALRALGRTSDEQQAIETYLSRYPDGFEARSLRRRLEVLQRR